MTDKIAEWRALVDKADKADAVIKKHNITYFRAVRGAWRKRRWLALPFIIVLGPVLVPLLKGAVAIVKFIQRHNKRISAESGTEFASMLPYSVGTSLDSEHEPWPTDALLFEKTMVVEKISKQGGDEPIMVFNASGDGPRAERHVVGTVPVRDEKLLESVVRKIDNAIKKHEGLA